MQRHDAQVNTDTVPPMGIAPEGQDFEHPYVISAIVSAICFGVGFLVLWLGGLWGKIGQWADAPFMIYFAILLPVLVGFTTYGVALGIAKVRRKRAK